MNDVQARKQALHGAVTEVSAAGFCLRTIMTTRIDKDTYRTQGRVERDGMVRMVAAYGKTAHEANMGFWHAIPDAFEVE